MTHILGLFLLFFSFSGLSQKTKEYRDETDTMCSLTWKYIKLKEPITGQVIFHEKARGNCGILAFASVTLIRLKSNDTVRIVEMCNTEKDFRPKQMVRITPEEGIRTGLVPHDPLECRLKRTHFGKVISLP